MAADDAHPTRHELVVAANYQKEQEQRNAGQGRRNAAHAYPELYAHVLACSACTRVMLAAMAEPMDVGSNWGLPAWVLDAMQQIVAPRPTRVERVLDRAQRVVHWIVAGASRQPETVRLAVSYEGARVPAVREEVRNQDAVILPPGEAEPTVPGLVQPVVWDLPEDGLQVQARPDLEGDPSSGTRLVLQARTGATVEDWEIEVTLADGQGYGPKRASMNGAVVWADLPWDPAVLATATLTITPQPWEEASVEAGEENAE